MNNQFLFVQEPFIEYLIKHPYTLVFDIGSNIGQYTLFAAKLGHDVISVEPFFENIRRIHKAAFLESIQDKITLVSNALSNTNGDLKQLNYNPINVGAQNLINLTSNYKSKYLTTTVNLDDMVQIIPMTKNGKKYKKAIMKIDIEGAEPLAFENAKKLFKAIEICIIFMEFGSLPSNYSLYDSIKNMIDFLYENDFVCFDEYKRILERKAWPSWPMDLVWKKKYDC